jgi:hypothetical protein
MTPDVESQSAGNGTAIVVMWRPGAIAACRALAEASADLAALARDGDLPVGLAAVLEGHATVLGLASQDLNRDLDPETAARAAHPAGRARLDAS